MKRKEAQLKRTKQDFSQKLLDDRGHEVELGRPNSTQISPMSTSPSYPRPSISTTMNPMTSSASHRPSISNSVTSSASTATGASQPGKADFQPNEGYRWDVCIVLPNHDFVPENETPAEEAKRKETAEEQRKFYEEVMERLFLAGLQTYSFLSGDGDEIYIKIRASLSRLQTHAELRETLVQLDADYLRKNIDNRRQPIMDNEDMTSLPPYQYIYAPYKKDKAPMYAKADGLNHPFSAILRIKLIMDIIDADEPSCCKLKLRKLLDDSSEGHTDHIIAYYPLHDYERREELIRVWLNWKVNPWEQPIDEVKDYLGEKVALYFEFTAHYTTWLLPLSVAGVLVGLDMMIETAITQSFNEALLAGYSIPFYCIFVSFWSQLMIEYWKRQESRKAMEWGMSSFEENEAERPEFVGSPSFSYIDGRPIKFVSPADQFRKILHSAVVIIGMMFLVIACVSAIFYLQYLVHERVDDDNNKSSGNTGVSILSAIQIIVLNSIYSGMAITMTDKENHRTDTEYDDSLIVKLFAFSFINSYASLFFIAFVKSNLGDPCQGPCMVELAYQLAIIFASKLTLDKISTYMTLVVNRRLRERKEEAQYTEAIKQNRMVQKPSKAELEKRLEEYKPSLGVLEDYAQIFVQFGFVTLFVSACPIAPLLAYISNYIEIRADGYKLMKFMRRVVPSGAQDIGTWLVILQMTAIISVLTNAGIVCFTMELLTFSGVGMIWLFIGFQYVILISMVVFSLYVDDVPPEVVVQLKRQDYLVHRALMTEQEREEADNESNVNQLHRHEFDLSLFQPHELDDEPVP
eukprot:gene3205-3510_t